MTARNESQDLDLSRRQNSIANMLRDELRDFRRNAALPLCTALGEQTFILQNKLPHS
ncbi:hypothetical protein HDF16_004855 [Granulicella aggregans]|uniref:Uncharacterized protein n=1 Tax=Granulicella aggregans TaxID=474949 RepID=A0A7W7ZIF5_9BACT|nr:hypothetical protein [Granulicella aggregans]